MKNRLMEDFKSAMKSRDEIRKNTINMVRAAIKQVEVDNRVELSDEEIIPIITKQVKMRKDALADFEKGGRTDLVDVYKQEIEVLSQYLPKQLDENEILSIVKEVALDMNISDGKENMGKLMGATMKKIGGKASGDIVKKVVMDFLK